MVSINRDILNLLCCPECRGKVELGGAHLVCSSCRREYQIFADDFCELLPNKFPEWELMTDEPFKAEESYRKEFNRCFTWAMAEGGWNDLASAPAGIRAFYSMQNQEILRLLEPTSHSTAIDISGAVGNCAVFLSGRLKTVINCDLHAPSLITAYKRKPINMTCIRTPYLQLPFMQHSVDYVICLDTLARGRHHEIKLLREINRILKVGGKAIVDFHNKKWFSQNKNICEYKVQEVRQMLREADIPEYTIHPFGFVPAKLTPREFLYPVLNKFSKIFLPCQRHIVVFRKRTKEYAECGH